MLKLKRAEVSVRELTQERDELREAGAQLPRLPTRPHTASAALPALCAGSCLTRAGSCAVDSQTGPWFEDVKRGVEGRVRDAMRLAESLQARLDATQAQHAVTLNALNLEKSDLSGHLATTLATCHDLEAALKQAR